MKRFEEFKKDKEKILLWRLYLILTPWDFLAHNLLRNRSTRDFYERKYDQLKDDLSEIIENCDDREMLYNSNYVMANLTFLKNRSPNSEAFSFLEKCVLEYPEEEENFGFVASALVKISNVFSDQKKFIGTSRCYELHLKSDHPGKNKWKIKENLDKLLERDLGGLRLLEATRGIFLNDGFPDYGGDYVLRSLRGLESNINVRGGFSLYPSSREEVDVTINTYREGLPSFSMTLPSKTVDEMFLKKTFKLDLTEFIRNKFRGEFKGFSYEERRRVEANCKDVAFYLRQDNGIFVREMDVINLITYRFYGRRYAEKTTEVIGFIDELIFKENISIRDFLISGGVDPYNWVYHSELEWK